MLSEKKKGWLNKLAKRGANVVKGEELRPWSNSAVLLCDLEHISDLRILLSPPINWFHYDRLRPLLVSDGLWVYREFHSFNNSSWRAKQVHSVPRAEEKR